MNSPRPDQKRISRHFPLVRTGSFKEMRDKYYVHPTILGTGTYGKVFLAHTISNPEIKVAIKTLSMKKLTEKAINDIKKEIKILQTLNHPNIIKFIETFENEKHMFIVMEYGEGGELFDKLTEKENVQFDEQEVAKIMKKLFGAIEHSHSGGITHRDLKPENIMYKEKNQSYDSDIKIIDFGLGKLEEGNSSKMNTTGGTPYYVAPEVLKGKGYGNEGDIWSLGVIMYVLLSGYLPFFGHNLADIYDKILKKEPSFLKDCWENVSEEAIKLIKGGLTKNPKNRITAEQALESPWFKQVSEKEANMLPDSVFESQNINLILKNETKDIFIKTNKEDEGENSCEEFKKSNSSSTGTNSAKDIETAIESTGKQAKVE